MPTVWKAKIVPNSERDRPYEIRVKAKRNARPLRVMKQGDDVCVWFEVDTHLADADMVLWCVGTGFGWVPPDTSYLDSVIDGPYVWHFYYMG